ncbi:MAG: acyl-CoA dehydratase activase-related protein [Bacillota bacterium]
MSPKTIGIPRALFYYYLFPLWNCFFTELGFKVKLSRKTDKTLVDLGVQKAVDELCYPVKIYYGHLASLVGEVDYIFLPRLISIEKGNYICPKFMGLPDMIKANFINLPEIIDEKFDFKSTGRGLTDSLKSIGQKLGIEAAKTKRALKKAQVIQNKYEEELQKGFTPVELLEGYKKNIPAGKEIMTIGLVGHGYNIYDSYASQNIIKKLEDMYVRVVTPEMVDKKILEAVNKSQPKQMYWSLGKKSLGCSLYVKENKQITGLIYLSSFGCGPDSMLAELVEKRFRRNGQKPFLNIVIDEHTGEAGLQTRLEAFIDMIARREVI